MYVAALLSQDLIILTSFPISGTSFWVKGSPLVLTSSYPPRLLPLAAGQPVWLGNLGESAGPAGPCPSSPRTDVTRPTLLCCVPAAEGGGAGLCPQGWSGGTRQQPIPLSNSGAQDPRAHRPPRRGHAPQYQLGQALK